MTINYKLPQDAGPKAKALVDRLQAIAKDRTRQNSDQDLRDTAISELITLVAELERDVIQIKTAAKDAKQKADNDELQSRGYGGSR